MSKKFWCLGSFELFDAVLFLILPVSCFGFVQKGQCLLLLFDVFVFGCTLRNGIAANVQFL